MQTGRSQGIDLRFRRWRPSIATPQHRSLWVDEALTQENVAPTPLEGEARAGVCIVGGGFTGLWTAIRLRELDPALDVVIVEADLCGTGASGRNSGGIGTWWGKLAPLIRLLGKQEALSVLQASVRAVEDIEAFVAARGIDCDFRHTKSVWSATAPAQVGAWEGAFRAAEQLGLEPPWRRLGEEEMRDLFGHRSPHLAGVMDEHGTRAQPALLARGLRRAAVGAGVRIYERSPVARIADHGAAVKVETTGGAVIADQVVLAANAWMAHLPEFRPYVMVVSSEIVATDPIPELLDKHGMRHRPGGHNSRLMLNYGGITPKGQVYLGRGGGTIAYDAHVGPKFDWSAKQTAEVEDDFRFLYPELEKVPIARSWAGPIDRSTMGLPWFGRLANSERILYGIGYSGHGVGASALGGRILASMVLKRADEWTALEGALQRARHGRYPPEPVRYIGGHLVRAAVARKERAERERRQPTRLDKALARLAPATISEFRRQPT
ncbi:FAD-binding oxidoreductase [Reyranella sp. CPCC 100927]|uniref:NAD(P)/FAD-dependent oxidoreductase n=1 Tax=Reyranella sp. CPCC 100927 TaxID=2599616 RepID=UPI0011B4FF65|nr:FAD-dependent oxidoreductase [Reyranella sp. CPCC 100927]TWT08681.1 FAD-dependent oxidoreductase [Reyranella sp. CPCC 100927]